MLITEKLIEHITCNIKNSGYSHVGNLFKDDALNTEDTTYFKSFWETLKKDDYMKDGGVYRYRRYAVFRYNPSDDSIVLQPIQPHYQTLNYNSLNGGVKRHYLPFEKSFIDHDYFKQILAFTTSTMNTLCPNSIWHLEAHQFRIKAGVDIQGLPTPEGIHQDGRDYVFIMMINCNNVEGGITHLYDNQKNLTAKICMRDFSHCLLLDDQQVWHSVDAIEPKNLALKEAKRDVLVITFKKIEG